MTSPSAPTPNAFPYDAALRRLMAQAQIPSYRALSQQSGVSRTSLNHLRQGHIGKLRFSRLQQLSQALGVSATDLIQQFSDVELAPITAPGVTSPAATIAALRQDYDRLRQQMTHQEQETRQQVQREALTVIESWLLMWPNAVQAAQDKPDLLASKVIPLTRPLQELLQTWAVQPIGAVGETVPYDPHSHQADSPLEPGQPVRIRNVGYRHGDRLLHRARVVAAAGS